MKGYQSALSLLPVHIRAGAEGLTGKERETAMEFRLRRGYVPTVLLPNGEKGIHEHPVKPSDLISARGCGRLKVLSDDGQSRRGRVVLNLFRYGK